MSSHVATNDQVTAQRRYFGRYSGSLSIHISTPVFFICTKTGWLFMQKRRTERGREIEDVQCSLSDTAGKYFVFFYSFFFTIRAYLLHA